MDHRSLVFIRLGHRGCIEVVIFGLYDDLDGQIVFAGKIKIALVVRRDGHDGAGAVFHQHEIGGPDGDLFPRERIDSIGACENAFLVSGFAGALDFIFARDFLDERVHRFFLTGSS